MKKQKEKVVQIDVILNSFGWRVVKKEMNSTPLRESRLNRIEQSFFVSKPSRHHFQMLSLPDNVDDNIERLKGHIAMKVNEMFNTVRFLLQFL